MSVLFQFFSAKDLKKLVDNQKLEEFKWNIQNAMRLSPDTFLRLAVAGTLESHWGDACRELQMVNSRLDPTQLTIILRERAQEVFDSLMSPIVAGAPPDDPLNFNAPLLPQLLSPGDLGAIQGQGAIFDIFEIAISCELSYFLSSSLLHDIEDVAKKAFHDLVGGDPEFAPDTRYKMWTYE